MRGELKGFVAKTGPYILFIFLVLALLLVPSFTSANPGDPVILFIGNFSSVNNNSYAGGVILLNATINENFSVTGAASFNMTWYYTNSTSDWVTIGANLTPTNVSPNGAEFTLWWNTSTVDDINGTAINASSVNATYASAVSENITNVTIDNTLPTSLTFITVPVNNSYSTVSTLTVNVSFADDFGSSCLLEYYNTSENMNVDKSGGGLTNYSMTYNVTPTVGSSRKYCNITISSLIDTLNNTDNYTVYVKDALGNTLQSSRYFHYVDTNKPNITFYSEGSDNYTIQNTSTDMFLNITINYSEWNRDTIKLYIWDNLNHSTIYDLTNAIVQNDGTNYVLVSMKIENVSNIDGMFTITAWANDSAGNSVWYDDYPDKGNHTGYVSHLIGGRWIIVTHTGAINDENITLEEFYQRIPYLHYASKWNDFYDAKNWTTFAISAVTTNNDVEVSRNFPVALYVNTSVTYFRNDTYNTTTLENFSLTNAFSSSTHNETNTTNWNLVGRIREKDANTTLHFYEDYHGYPGGNTTFGNLTAISFYNQTAGNYVSCYLRFRYCTGTGLQNVTEVKILPSYAVWMNMNVNWTINITLH